MSGKAAAFGGRMMSTVADQILKQFADNFAAQVGALQALRAAPAPRDGGAHAFCGANPLPPARPLNALALGVDTFKRLAARPILQDGRVSRP